LILATLLRYAAESDHSVVVTGELLPGGRQAIVKTGNLLIVHLPAALSLTKHRTEHISEAYGRRIPRRQFGCRLVADTHAKGWMNVGPSIKRVLRELQAGILTTGQALEYIKAIVKSVPDMECDAEE
jgi:predicted PP-loop superfamily ATPase